MHSNIKIRCNWTERQIMDARISEKTPVTVYENIKIIGDRIY